MRTYVVVGAVVLIIGLVALGIGAALWVNTPSEVKTSVLGTQQYVLRKGDEVSITVSALKTGERLTGTFTQVNGTTVYLYFMTPDQQHDWGDCAPCSSPALVNASNPVRYDYNWAINDSGTYFLILDNSYGNVESVSLTAFSIAPNNPFGTYETLVAVGAVIAVVGVAVSAIGLRAPKKTQ